MLEQCFAESFHRNMEAFPLFERSHRVLVYPTGAGMVGAYYTSSSNLLAGTTHALLRATSDECYVIALAVASGMRRKGVGRALLRCLEQVGEDCNCQKITLDAKPEAVPFYVKCGYELTREILDTPQMSKRFVAPRFVRNA